MKPVIIESPFAGDTEKNIYYARLCLLDCLLRKEAPFASHLLYTQILEDSNMQHREVGMNAGFAIGDLIDTVVVYTDRGITDGMKLGIERAEGRGATVEYRQLYATEEVE